MRECDEDEVEEKEISHDKHKNVHRGHHLDRAGSAVSIVFVALSFEATLTGADLVADIGHSVLFIEDWHVEDIFPDFEGQ